jgi:hypothetical protein
VSRALLLVALLAAIFAVSPTPRASADTGLTSAIATAYILRHEDAQLHAIAHERVTALAACDCLEHDGMASGTAEVIAYNIGVEDPVGSVIGQWQRSGPHHAILSNREYGRIGCAELVAGGTHWFACVLTRGDLPPAPTAAPPPPPQGGFLLPNTALPTGG